jgi:hypothetical protein
MTNTNIFYTGIFNGSKGTVIGFAFKNTPPTLLLLKTVKAHQSISTVLEDINSTTLNLKSGE